MWGRVDLVWPDVSEERRVAQNHQRATSQKTAFLIATAVKNLKSYFLHAFLGTSHISFALRLIFRINKYYWDYNII
jgi:hypothetical protein